MLELLCYTVAFVLFILAALPAVPHRDKLLAIGLAAFTLPDLVHAAQVH